MVAVSFIMRRPVVYSSENSSMSSLSGFLTAATLPAPSVSQAAQHLSGKHWSGLATTCGLLPAGLELLHSCAQVVHGCAVDSSVCTADWPAPWISSRCTPLEATWPRTFLVISSVEVTSMVKLSTAVLVHVLLVYMDSIGEKCHMRLYLWPRSTSVSPILTICEPTKC